MKISDLLSQIETYMKAGSLTPDSEVSIELLVNFRIQPEWIRGWFCWKW